jgi:hypothetical protein
MAVRNVAALFPFVMETIRTGYWKISSRAAIWLPVSKISSSNAESNLGRISLNVVEAESAFATHRVTIKLLTDAQAKPCVIAAWRFNNPEEEIPDVRVFPTSDKAGRRYPVTA